MALTKLERNEIFRAIAASSLDPDECTLNQNDNEVLITHTNSGSTFKFTFVGTGHVDIYAVQSDVVDGHHLRFQTAYEIDSVTPFITEWAEEARVTFDTPDLWAEMRRSRELIAATQRADFSNAPFTQDEQQQIAALLQEIKKQVSEQFELTNEQMAQVNEKLDELSEASTRMGRKDWLIIALGTIAALIITATVLPGIGEHILAMIIHGLGHLFTGGNEPPRILA